MRIEIWSDVVCPWCSIGKARLDRAIAGFAHRDDVEVVYRSFQLDPGASTDGALTAVEHLGRKYGGGTANGRRMVDRVEAAAAEEGMLWRHHESRPVNTLDAHRLLHLALAEAGPESQAALKEELFAAYFSRAENVADHDVLRAAAGKAGLDAARVDEVLAGSEFREEVFADQDQAGAYGAGGVPFFVVDGRFGISGAQPVAAFSQVLERAWAESHPVIEMVGPGTHDACGPDGCAI